MKQFQLISAGGPITCASYFDARWLSIAKDKK